MDSHACTTRRRGEFLVLPGMLEIASSPPVGGTAGRRSCRSLSSETSVAGDTSTCCRDVLASPATTSIPRRLYLAM
uniref:Uncharacterized protein n=1 Tax=Oryza glumipatula TaxID=40148 RepID=A0A0D9YQ86_9ORYZ